ncbi:hypothetical protein L218DRAFT_1071882 [Marasmius fiardii PR-910]|nr:hypothetical protein L218DRAFT_1071882 [Marasmius fiardii PR-910]
MLKRPRPPSPLSSGSNSALSDSLDMILPTAKRRRVLPRSSDHPSQSTHPGNNWEDDEEDLDEPERSFSHPAAADSPYKDTNSFLYELHTLQRHRQLFSQQRQSPHLQEAQSNRGTHLLQYAHRHDELPLSSQSGVTASLGPAVYSGNHKLQSGFSDCKSLHETEAVRARYEDTNRLLGSLFLSRRQELADDDKERPHR